MRIHINTSYPTVDQSKSRYSVVVLMFDGSTFQFVKYDFQDKCWYPKDIDTSLGYQLHKFNYMIRKKFVWIYLPVNQMSKAFHQLYEDNQ